MPFLGLDDKLHFPAIKKIWIFIVFASVLLLLTFVIPTIWQRIARRDPPVHESQAHLEVEGHVDNENETLEPKPVKENTLLEFLQMQKENYNQAVGSETNVEDLVGEAAGDIITSNPSRDGTPRSSAPPSPRITTI